MTTASPTTTAESVELSDTDAPLRFQTAREYFEGRDPARDPNPEAPAFAKAIVWFDQETPLFVCGECHEHVRPLRFEGDGRADDYDERRAEAYRRLFEDAPRCDVCAGELPEKVDR